MKTSSFEVDGNAFTLEFDFDLLVKAEEATGFNLLTAVMHIDLVGAAVFRALLLALLWKHHPALELAGMGALITPDTLPKIGQAIAALWPETAAA